MIRATRPLTIAIAAGAFAGILLSHKLWLNSRLYPLVPAWPLRHGLPTPLDWILLAAMLTMLVLVAALPRPRVAVAAFIALAICAAWQDQSRWQPWFYQYVFMLAAIGWASADPARQQAALDTCRLIMASIYVWSGLAKLNSGFRHDIIPFLLEPFHLQHSWIANHAMLAAPFLETSIGVALLSRRFRRAALAGAIAMHLFVLWSIGPWGNNYNSVVWPWNLAMIAFLTILFGRTKSTPAAILWTRDFAFQRAVLLLFAIAPALSFFNLWDDYLSFAFYAGNANSASISVSDAAYDRLPEALDDYVYQDGPDLNSLSISDWSRDELNVPPYAEFRVFRNVGSYLCRATGEPAGLQLVIREKRGLLSGGAELRYGCPDLRP